MMYRRAFMGLAAGGLLAAKPQEGRGTLPRVGSLENTGSAIGGEAIKGVLTGHKQWTFYWDRASRGRRPRLGSTTTDRSPSAKLEFMRVGLRLIGHAEEVLPYTGECDFEVTVREDGFTFVGCWGSDKPMTYDPDDREYPFKGRTDGMLCLGNAPNLLRP
jgi:hypothetical protein